MRYSFNTSYNTDLLFPSFEGGWADGRSQKEGWWYAGNGREVQDVPGEGSQCEFNLNSTLVTLKKWMWLKWLFPFHPYFSLEGNTSLGPQAESCHRWDPGSEKPASRAGQADS